MSALLIPQYETTLKFNNPSILIYRSLLVEHIGYKPDHKRMIRPEMAAPHSLHVSRVP